MKATDRSYIFEIPDKEYFIGEEVVFKGKPYVVIEILRTGKIA